jgi:hypothetical protein
VAAADDDGPDAGCYDAVEPRRWEYPGGGQLTALRSLELVWLRFDSNPAAFATFVEGEQAFEDFLSGPPAGPVTVAVVAEARAYLRGARTPGRSTWLALEVGPGLGAASWTLDGVNPDLCALPGPASAGVYGGASPDTRRGIRALARPGRVEVRVRAVALATHAMVDAALTLDLVAHQPRRLRVALVAGGAAPACAVTEVPAP